MKGGRLFMANIVDEYDELDDLLPTNKKKKRKKEEILQQLKDVEEYDPYNGSEPTPAVRSFLPSSLLKDQSKKNQREKDENSDKWFSELVAYNTDFELGKGHPCEDLFGEEFGGRKKKKHKKKKEKGEPTDFKKEFEPEMALLRNILIDQNRFTESLQREYDKLSSTKSSARGTNKSINDLIANINGARSLAMQLVEKQLNAKKTIADLSMKERKELGVTGDGADLSEFAANFLKQTIQERSNIISADIAEVGEYSDDEIFNELNTRIHEDDNYDTSMMDESNIFVKYENVHPEVFVEVNANDDGDWNFITKDQDGNVIPDYPEPPSTSMNINHSTGYATDNYGEKYKIIWR